MPRDRAAWREQRLERVEAAKRVARALQVKSGEVPMPLICGWCTSRFVTLARRPNPDIRGGQQELLACVSCGRDTELVTAHRLRRQRIAAYIRDGSDVDLTNTPTTQGGRPRGANDQGGAGGR